MRKRLIRIVVAPVVALLMLATPSACALTPTRPNEAAPIEPETTAELWAHRALILVLLTGYF